LRRNGFFDYATRDPRARLATRICLIVVPVGVNNEAGTAFAKERIFITLFKRYTGVVLVNPKIPAWGHLEVPKITSMRSFPILKSVPGPTGFEMPAR
jgi:hypothetical protein